MKRLILILFLLPIILVNGQVFKKNSSWTHLTTNIIDESYCRIATYKLDGDTIVDGKEYSKLYFSSITNGQDDDYTFCVGLRESENNEIFINPFDSYMPGEHLLYDFSPWEIGDTLRYQFSVGDEIEIFGIISEIDTIQLLDNNYYQVIPYTNHKIIRGIGHTMGFFAPIQYFPNNGNQYKLLCFWHGDQLVYKDENYDDCDPCGRVSLDYISEDKDRVEIIQIPQGVDILLPISQGNEMFLYIYDLSGKILYQQDVFNQQKVSISDLPQGVYLYKITGGQKNYSGKFSVLY